MKQKTSLIEKIEKLISGELTLHEQDKLLNICYNIAYVYVNNYYGQKFSDFLNDESLSVTCAFASISELFSLDKKKNTLGMASALKSWRLEMKSDEDVFFFLNSVIGRRAEQEVTQVLRDRSPEFSKILRRIKYLAMKEGMNILPFFGQKFIVPGLVKQINGPAIGYEEFSNLPVRLFNIDDNSVLRVIIEHLINNTHFFPAIPLNQLVKTLTVHSMVQLPVVSFEKPDEGDSLYLRQVIDESLRPVHKIIDGYAKNGKVNMKTASYIKKSLRDCAEDLLEFGESAPLYEYLGRYLHTLTEPQIKRIYGNRLKYLFRTLKKNIAKRLWKELR